jgi:glutathione S-transferase
MQLYSNPLSPNVRRVRLTACVLGIELDERPLDFSRGEHKQPAYLALNPNGAVPTLVDGDLVLTESRAIMQYLAAQRPGLLPDDARARVEVTRWQFWDASHFSPALGALAFEKVVKPLVGLGAPDPVKVAEALAGFRRFAAVLDHHLAGRRYVVGEALTIADLTLAASLTYARQTDVPVGEFPNVEAWLARISELEAWQRTAP